MMRRPAIALCGIAVCVWFAAVGEAQTLVPPTTSGRQLVVPFENAANEPRVFWLGEGSAVLLTDDLQTLGVPAISRDDRLRAFERLRVPRAAIPTRRPTVRRATTCARSSARRCGC